MRISSNLTALAQDPGKQPELISTGGEPGHFSALPAEGDGSNSSGSDPTTSSANSGERPAFNSNRHDHTGLDVAIEFAEGIHNKTDAVHKTLDWGNGTLKLLTGIQAFRKYSWLRNAPIRNRFGNFRGMVVSPIFKTVFDVTVENADKLEKYGQYLAVAGVALDIVKQHEMMGKIWGSRSMQTSEKAQRLITLGSMAVFKAVGAPIPLATHVIAEKLAWVCNVLPATKSLGENVQLVDFTIQTSYKQMMDSENVVHYINTHLVLSDGTIDKVIAARERLGL
jgi:hypothetical protein